MASRSAKKGRKSNVGGPKPSSANSNGMENSYIAKAAGFKRGGVIGSSMSQAPFGGPSAAKRLDRPGRKRGGAIGADTSPLTHAASVSPSGSANEE